MRPTGRILIVDDDRMFLDTYRDLLSRDGYTVEDATTREAALARLDENDWDVVLLDQKLLGPSGPDQGIELVEEVRARAPGAKSIIVTAYASDQSVQRAFDLGVYDFLEKSGAFAALLRAKVRNAMEMVRERGLGYLRDEQAERQIAERWNALAHETDPNRKGLVLEELIMLVFRSIDGFQHVSSRRKNENEEIDLVIRNESRDAFWSQESPYILVECKHWSRPAGRDQLDTFQAKLRRRFGRAKLGFFVAAGGFTKGFLDSRRHEGQGDILIVCIGPEGLEELVASHNRSAVLKGYHDRAIVDANGGSH